LRAGAGADVRRFPVLFFLPPLACWFISSPELQFIEPPPSPLQGCLPYREPLRAGALAARRLRHSRGHSARVTVESARTLVLVLLAQLLLRAHREEEGEHGGKGDAGGALRETEEVSTVGVECSVWWM
jgi:hypothetical protein